MGSNVQEFEKNVRETAQKLSREDFVTFHKKITFEALSRIVVKTPVDKGRARGNWQVTIGLPASSVLKSTDRTGNNTITKGLGKLTGLKPFQVVFITNNVPYILVLEYGLFVPKDPGPSKDKRKDRFGRILVQQGYSVQAPQGMVDVTAAELNVIFT